MGLVYKIRFGAALLCCLLFCKSALFAQLQFNEVVSKNAQSLVINNQSPDWIELKNTSEDILSLSDLYLSDDKDLLTLWAFPDVDLNPNQLLIILADGTDEVNDYYHTNFKISSSGERLYLSNSEGAILDELLVPALEEDLAFAQINDEWNFAIPTPGTMNANMPLETSGSAIFSMDSGYFTENFDLEILPTNPNGIVEYYLNNYEGEALVYENALSITSNTIICARQVESGLLPSPFICKTYLFEHDHSLPILSVLANDDDLFNSETGVFVEGPNASSEWPYLGANYWEDLESEVLFEYRNFKDSAFQGRADIAMHGGRESRTQAQKTFKLLAKEKYGQAFFEFPFFDDKPDLNSFKRLVVRNASGDHNAGHCRDGFLQSYLLSKPLNLDANAYEPIVVYINGNYYGMMGLREKMDKYYLETNYGIKAFDLLEEQIVTLEGDDEHFVSSYDFVLSHDLSNKHLYTQAASMFDLENMVDYFICQIGNNSTAWPQNNIKFWRGKLPSDKWRYLLFDMDISLGRHEWTIPEENSLLNKLSSFADTNVFINTLYGFLENEAFRHYFFNRHQDIYNTTLHPEIMLPAFNEFVFRVEDEMPHHFDQWPSATFENWENVEIENIRNFIKERPAYAMQYMDDFFDLGGLVNLKIDQNITEAGIIHLNSLDNIDIDKNWIYFKHVPILLEAKPLPGYYFNHWEIQENGNTYTVPVSKLQRRFSMDDTSIMAVYSSMPDHEWLNSVLIQSDRLEIKLNNEIEEDLALSLYNTMGQEIMTRTIQSPHIGTHFIEWNVDYLPSGQLILLAHQKDRSYVQRITKVK